jgi:hypothetical protein
VWRHLELPAPRCVFQSTQPQATECGGIRLIGLDELKREAEPHLIVLSSQRFETEMAESAGRVFPAVPTIRFWS